MNGRGVALIDDRDAELVGQYVWKLKRGPHEPIGYALCRIGGKTVYMHQLLCPGAKRVDHKDHNTLNNQRDNLRSCTHQQNLMSQKKQARQTTSQYKGVSLRKDKKKWRAYIQVEDKSMHLGYFTSEEDAALAYNEAAQLHFGEFAFLNKIVPPAIADTELPMAA